MELGLDGRCAVVTGGTKGIGRAIVDELVAEGANVAFCARHPKEVATAEDEIRHQSPATTIVGHVCDVTHPASVEDFISEAVEGLGGLDILVNNAGGAHPGDFDSLTDADWQADLDIKLFSQIRCTRAALPHLQHSKAPRVININAVYARYPDPAFFATTVNRAACLNLTKVLARQYGHVGVLVNSVNIGFVDTPQWENIHRKRDPDTPKEEFLNRLAGAEVPLGRFGDPLEVSGLVVFLASDRASYLTGASIDAAGGMGKYV